MWYPGASYNSHSKEFRLRNNLGKAITELLIRKHHAGRPELIFFEKILYALIGLTIVATKFYFPKLQIPDDRQCALKTLSEFTPETVKFQADFIGDDIAK